MSTRWSGGREPLGGPTDDPEGGSRLDRRLRRIAKEIESYEDPVVRRRNTIVLVVGFAFVALFFAAVIIVGS